MSEEEKSGSKLGIFEDNISAYHPAYAFKKTGKGVITDKLMFVSVIFLVFSMLLDLSPVYVYYQIGIMAGWNFWLPSKDPEGTDALKVESYLSKVLSKGPIKNLSVKARKSALKAGGIPCEEIKYIP
jgi:hypothetical protein